MYLLLILAPGPYPKGGEGQTLGITSERKRRVANSNIDSKRFLHELGKRVTYTYLPDFYSYKGKGKRKEHFHASICFLSKDLLVLQKTSAFFSERLLQPDERGLFLSPVFFVSKREKEL